MEPFESGYEEQEASVVAGEFVISGGDAAEVFDLAEEAFDEVAFPVERCIEGSARGGGLAAWDDRDSATRSGGIDSALGIITLVGEDEAGADAVEQRFDLSDVVALAAGQ